ncbi:nitrate- and nitrite sensing domain-containing protein [Streptomyces xantholiticus]
MQMKRPRGNGGRPTGTPSTGALGDHRAPASPQPIPAPRDPDTVEQTAVAAVPRAADEQVPAGRPRRVRNRLVAGVAVTVLLVVGAGAPGILASSADLTESQRLVTLAALDRQAVTLAHSLADERDEVTAYIAAGRDDQGGDKKDRRKISGSLSARVDRQIDEMRDALDTDRADLRHSLASVPSVRRAALTGKGTALEAHQAYTTVISALHALAGELADRTPPRAAEATRAPAELGLAVEQASAARGLLLAALAVPQPEPVIGYDPVTGLPVENAGEDTGADARARNALTAAAQQARVRELAALADFDQAAGKAARDKVDATVTGPEVKSAETYLARLTDRPELSDTERGTDPAKLEAALTARIEQMRGAESSLATERTARFEQLRDDDLTALEIRIALLGGLVVVTIGVLAAVSRTLTRPLAVLRIGAARLADAPDPQAEEPVRFTGRNDEFAQVVRSLNDLHGKLRDLGTRAGRLEGERGDLIGAREGLEAELAAARAELRQRTEEIGTELDRLRHTVHHTFVNLSLRTLGLVERQLGVIEKLEEREQDPERLATLFKLDHMATVMRRHSENLLVLAGTEHGHGHVGPVPLVDVLRAAVSEIERYERVVIQSLPPHAQVAGFAADDLSHLVAELLENATSFSPPDAQVELSGWLLESGEVMLSVQDAGIGMTAGRIAEINARLEDPESYEAEPPAGREGEGLGLRVAGLLAARLGVRIQLREHKQGGITAVVVVPGALLPTGPPAGAGHQAPVAGGAPALNLPGSVAEANSNALPANARRSTTPPPAGSDAPAGPDVDALAGPDVDALAGPDLAGGLDPDVSLGRSPDAPVGHDPASDADPDVHEAAPAVPTSADDRGGVSQAADADVSTAPAGGPDRVGPEDAAVAPGLVEDTALYPADADPAGHEAVAVDPAEADHESVAGGPDLAAHGSAATAPGAFGGPDLAGGLAPDVFGGPDPAGGLAPGASLGHDPVPAADADPDAYEAVPAVPASADDGSDMPGLPVGTDPAGPTGPAAADGPFAQAEASPGTGMPVGEAAGDPAFAQDQAVIPTADPVGHEDAGAASRPASEDAFTSASGGNAAEAAPVPDFAHEPEPDPFVEAAERAIAAAAEPHTHERTVDGAPAKAGVDQETFAMRLPQPQGPEEEPQAPEEEPQAPAVWDRVTDKGLPKRTPKSVTPATAPSGRTGSVDAEALRRRLGGFHQGAKDGRRDAEAEIAQTAESAEKAENAHTEAETGDTVEEARS